LHYLPKKFLKELFVKNRNFLATTFIILINIIFQSDLKGQNTFELIGDSIGVFNSIVEAKQDFENNFIMTGIYHLNGPAKTILIKLNSNGDTVFTKIYGSQRDFFASSVEITTDSGYILSGNESTMSDSARITIIKTDSSGNIQWNKSFGDVVFGAVMGPINCLPKFSGGYIASLQSALSPVLIGLNSFGDTIWTKKYLNVGEIFDIRITSDTGIIFIGDNFVIKTDSVGNIKWAKKYSIILPNSKIREVDNHSYIFSFSDASGIHAVKIDSLGTTIWSTRYWSSNGGLYTRAMCITRSNEVVLCTYLDNGFSLIKIDETGDTTWVKSTGRINVGLSVEQTSDDGFVIGGTFSDTSSIYYFKCIVTKTDSLGRTGCNDNNSSLNISNYPMVDSVFSPLIDFGIPISSTTISLSSGVPFTNVCNTPTFVKNIQRQRLCLYPNPSNSAFNIVIPAEFYNSQIDIYNMLGKLIYSEKVYNRNTVTINTLELTPGIYNLTLKNLETICSKKLIVE
jgi:hypothetical protein